MLPRPSELKNIVQDWSRDEYFSDDALNFHALWDFQRDPKLYAAGFFATKEKTDAMRQGSQLHELVLEGSETFEANNVLWTPPVNEKTGKPYGQGTKNYTEALDALLAENPGKEIYTQEELDTYRAMYNAVLNHPTAGEYLFSDDPDSFASELKFRGEYAPGWFAKGAIDRYDSELGIIDLKTCAEIERFDGYKTFEKTCLYGGYLEQLAFYQIMFREFIDPRAGAWFVPITLIGIEKKPPYRVAVCKPDTETEEAAREKIYGLLEKYSEAVKEQRFDSRYDEIITLHRNSYNN